MAYCSQCGQTNGQGGCGCGLSIKVRWLELKAREVQSGLLLDATRPLEAGKAKEKALRLLGILRRPGETFSGAWLRALCSENGLDNVRPVPVPLRDAIAANSGAMRFLFFLS